MRCSLRCRSTRPIAALAAFPNLKPRLTARQGGGRCELPSIAWQAASRRWALVQYRAAPAVVATHTGFSWRKQYAFVRLAKLGRMAGVFSEYHRQWVNNTGKKMAGCTSTSAPVDRNDAAGHNRTLTPPPPWPARFLRGCAPWSPQPPGPPMPRKQSRRRQRRGTQLARQTRPLPTGTAGRWQSCRPCRRGWGKGAAVEGMWACAAAAAESAYYG